jgi:hypothetical protein
MKRFTALLLILAMMTGCLMTGCDQSSRRNRDRDREEEEEDEDDDDDDEEEETTSGRSHDLSPQHDFNNVDERFSFDNYYAEPITGEPWVIENNIPFTTGNVNTYYSLYPYTGNYDLMESANVLSNVATITRPIVRHYPAEQQGYTIYEVTYTETFPHRVAMPNGVSTGMMWRYHGVEFLDYYTGMVYPVINLSSETESFCVSGNVFYEDEQYTVYYYEFREAEEVSDNWTTDPAGNDIWEVTYVEYHTAYFVVPNGYDGIVMYVYTADDSDTSFEEALAEDDPYFTPPEPFEGNIDDYTFISIADLG